MISLLSLITFNKQICQCPGVNPPLVVKKKIFPPFKTNIPTYCSIYQSLQKSEDNPLLPVPWAEPQNPKTSHPSEIYRHVISGSRGGGQEWCVELGRGKVTCWIVHILNYLDKSSWWVLEHLYYNQRWLVTVHVELRLSDTSVIHDTSTSVENVYLKQKCGHEIDRLTYITGEKGHI